MSAPDDPLARAEREAGVDSAEDVPRWIGDLFDWAVVVSAVAIVAAPVLWLWLR